MKEQNLSINAEVIGVYPDRVKIAVDNLEDFQIAEEKLKIGSYLEISDNDNCKLIAIIENFSIEVNDKDSKNRKHILEAVPLGIISNGMFERGGDNISIPPQNVKPATDDDIEKIYLSGISDKDKFTFAHLSTNRKIQVPVNGNKFFNKHISIVGSTGSGKSNSIAHIIQKAISTKDGAYTGLNNSHVIIFDIHSEYRTAFPNSNYIDINNLVLPYWLLNSEELEELLIDTDSNDYNQRSILKEAIVKNKKFHNKDLEDKIHYDMPVYFDINEVLTYISNRNNEKNNKDINKVEWLDDDGTVIHLESEHEYLLFSKILKTCSGVTTNTQNGRFINFLNRLENKIHDKRYEFLLGQKSKNVTFKETLQNLLGYSKTKSNVVIFDLSGVPFEVLSITVSLISRIIFEYGYYYKRIIDANKNNKTFDVPLLLVYEEAHKYVPKSELTKYRASRNSIERIAKEGRKYGITLMLASQRPSEISETIFSQCNNFIAMRLTNPNDQNYVKKLLPDTFGNLINKIPSLKVGEALLIGDSTTMPSIVQIEECEQKPSSNDIPYFDLWKEEWKGLDFEQIINEWKK